MNIKEFITELLAESEQPVTTNNKLKKVGGYVAKYFLVCCITTIVMLVYVEVGHTRNWPKAERWHECLHTHGHFNVDLYFK